MAKKIGVPEGMPALTPHLHFNGNGDMVFVRNARNLPGGDVGKTIFAWFRTKGAAPTGNIGGFGNAVPGGNFQVGTSAGHWVGWGWQDNADWHTDIEMKPYEKHEIDDEKCTRCDTCREVCPNDAIRID